MPPSLHVGVFKPGNRYDAIVRFSNANEDPSVPDTEPDGRGMAIKLLSVGQPLLMPQPDTPDIQDFIMISHPVFIVADPKTYQTLVGYVDSDHWLTRQLEPLLAAATPGWCGILNAIVISSNQTDSPLNTRYWSMVAYQLGTGADARAIKFSAMPCIPRHTRRPATAGPDYLRQAMKDDLATGAACMRFMVQPRTAGTQSVEDPRYEWPESEAPFVDVARLIFAPRRFASPEALAACERLRYSPWHGLADHRPLGVVNRMRKVIYQRIGMARRQRAAETAVRLVEPEPRPPDTGD